MGSTGLKKDKEVPFHQNLLYASSGSNIEERAQVDWRQKQLLSFPVDTRRLKEVSMPPIYIYLYIILLSLKNKGYCSAQNIPRWDIGYIP